MSTQIPQALDAGGQMLARHGIEDPRTEAALLLAFALKKPREYVYMEPDGYLTAEQSETYRQALEQRARRVPYAYVVGKREFMGLEFFVNRSVLIPRPDTEILVETVLRSRCEDQGSGFEGGTAQSLLDLCTGSGAVALALAVHWPELGLIMGTDISDEALGVARFNAERLGVSRVVWEKGDLWDAVGERVFDCITVNPPYISTEDYGLCAPEVRCEPRLALWGGVDGLDYYRRIAAGAGQHLKAGGKIYMEIAWNQADSVRGLLERAGFVSEVFRDLAGRDRVVAAWVGHPKMAEIQGV
ncbi:MAG: peptide chain release factor N(5)-glutamine methyltransferase [Peptococcaceae bacterium]|nr:peptide chain release factor N(5)-glutamine methyltransferase [Peptococcaceae bacterium]